MVDKKTQKENWRLLTLNNETFNVHFENGEFYVQDYDIESQQIAEIVSATFPGTATFFVIAKRMYGELSAEGFALSWIRMKKDWQSDVLGDELWAAYQFFAHFNLRPDIGLRNKHCPKEIFSLLLRYPDVGLLESALSNEYIPMSSDFLNRIAPLFDGQLDDELVLQTNATSSILEMIVLRSGHNPRIINTIIAHPNVTGNILKKIAKISGYSEPLARNSKTPLSVLESLANQAMARMPEGRSTLNCLARNPSMTPALLRKLSESEMVDSKYLLANPNISDDLIVELVRKKQQKEKELYL